jgi:hypothetical protein
MITATMDLRGTNMVLALLVVLAVAIVLVFCAIVLSTQPAPA